MDLTVTAAVVDGLTHAAHNAEDSLHLNRVAMEAGELFVALRRDHAALESARKGLQLAIRDELMEGGMKKTEAGDQARDDARYLAHLERMQEVEALKDRCLVLYRLAQQRAWILLRVDPELPHPSPFSVPSEDAAAAGHSLGGLG